MHIFTNLRTCDADAADDLFHYLGEASRRSGYISAGGRIKFILLHTSPFF